MKSKANYGRRSVSDLITRAYDKPAFSWLADSNAPDVKSGVATFTYAQFDSGEIFTEFLRFESFATAHAVSKLLDAAHKAGHEKGIAEFRSKMIALLEASHD